MVAEEFEPLIGAGAVARTLERGNVRERAIEQRRVGEPIADAVFERGACPAAAAGLLLPVGRADFRGGCDFFGRRFWARRCRGFAFPAAAHLTSVNSRLQRTVHGQRQISQACVPPLIEKKMICALPIEFSNGT